MTERTIIHANPHFTLSECRGFYRITPKPGVAVLAVSRDGLIAVIEIDRPAVGGRSVELPRGAVEAGEPPEQAAYRELEEETGIAPGRVAALERLGGVLPDSALLELRVDVFLARLMMDAGDALPGPADPAEGIHAVRFVRTDSLREAARTGYTDSFLLAALALYDAAGERPETP